jgi:hypothetical protein
MKTCPVCALEMDDGYLFCPEDGSSLAISQQDISMRDAGNLEDRRGEFGANDESANPVVLYCPACAAEYPLTFTACPVHGAQLVKHTIPKLRAVESKTQEAVNHATLLTVPNSEHEATPVADNATECALDHEEAGERFAEPEPLIPQLSEALPNDEARPFETPMFEPRSTEGSGFRLAAIATVVALVLFSAAALYTVVSNMSRRHSAPEVRVASNTEVALPFIPTPKEAQDYIEEQPVPLAAAPPVARAAEKKIAEPAATQSTNRVPATPQKTMSMPASPPSRVTQVSNLPLPALPRGESGGFDARLVRVRGLRTASGYRYDLTFNMQEQSGRSAQWQRILITTRSASGAAHSQAIPFVHRLGATGALTFTVGVELAGRTEADWRGHVVCTTLGWDNHDRPLQASFAANVTP